MSTKTEPKKLDPEILGLITNFSPFPDKTSSNRAGMLSTSLSQYQLLMNGESPNIFTGYEFLLPSYEHNFSELDDDFEILEILPQYSSISINGRPIGNLSNMFYILGRKISTSELHYHELRTFHKLNERYGYSTQLINQDLLRINNVVPKGTKFYTSIAHDLETGEYKFGINANTAFATLSNTVEDAFIISDELANKLTPEGFTTTKIFLNSSDFPLNLYGRDDEFKIFPDLGESIREDGILCAFRECNNTSIIHDFNVDNLKTPNVLDIIFYGEKGASIVDIDVIMNPKCLGHIDETVYNQILLYHQAKLNGYKRILSFYKKYRDRYLPSRMFNQLVTRVGEYLLLHDTKFVTKTIGVFKNKKRLGMTGEIEDSDMLIKITTKFKKPANIGSKITGRDGSKGVIGTIVPKDHMLTDEYGFRADLVIDPISVISRNNQSQLFESFINRISDIIIDQIKEMDVNSGLEKILKYLDIISPIQSSILREELTDFEDKKKYISHIKRHGLKINISGTHPNNIDNETIDILSTLYDTKISKATYKVEIDGKLETIETERVCCIGKKFIYMVYNEPEISAVNIGPINMMNLPTRVSPQSKNRSSHVKNNCTRFGEDEFRMMLTTLGPEVTIRLRELSNSLRGIETVVSTIVSADKPSDIPYFEKTTKELLDSDTLISVIHTLCNAFGLDLKNIISTPRDLYYYNKAMEACKDDLFDEMELLEDETSDIQEECYLDSKEGGND